jgi:hypothetical protein
MRGKGNCYDSLRQELLPQPALLPQGRLVLAKVFLQDAGQVLSAFAPNERSLGSGSSPRLGICQECNLNIRNTLSIVGLIGEAGTCKNLIRDFRRNRRWGLPNGLINLVSRFTNMVAVGHKVRV